jgi:hypothetical protein
MTHELPFHDSAKTLRLGDFSWESPAASHSATAAHDTVFSVVKDEAAGLGVVCSAHETPSQVAPALKMLPELSPY